MAPQVSDAGLYLASKTANITFNSITLSFLRATADGLLSSIWQLLKKRGDNSVASLYINDISSYLIYHSAGYRRVGEPQTQNAVLTLWDLASINYSYSLPTLLYSGAVMSLRWDIKYYCRSSPVCNHRQLYFRKYLFLIITEPLQKDMTIALHFYNMAIYLFL